jgi:hypothetical protein
MYLAFKVIAASLFILMLAQPLSAWPADAYRDIFEGARRNLPASLQRLLVDLEPTFSQPCPIAQTPDPDTIRAVANLAIQELSGSEGDLGRAVAAMRDLGCATAAMNDPSAVEMDDLVLAQKQNFAVVFYGWHPLIRDGNLSGYLEIRVREHQRLQDRFERTSELPSLSDQVALSPEFGLASLAFSHAITDVANVWMYVWTSVNGSLE